MRISDWSSDVCSSDLIESSVTSVVALILTAKNVKLTPSVIRARTSWMGNTSSGWGDSSGIPRSDESKKENENEDRKSVVSGKSVSVRVDLGGRRIMKKKKIGLVKLDIVKSYDN